MTSGPLHDDGDLASVGQAGIFEELRSSLRAARRGQVRTVVLNGRSGSGKTTVLDQFLRYCRSGRDVQVISASGDEWEARLPLAGYSQLMMRGPLRTAKGPEGVPTPSPGEDTELDPVQTANLAATFIAHLKALQARHDVVVAVDDVHLLDEHSVRILLFVMRRLQSERILFVLTLDQTRSGRVPAGMLDLLNSHRVRQLWMEPLSAEDVRELAQRRFGIDLEIAVAHRLVQHTRGFPRAVVELLGELPVETWQSWFSALPASSHMAARVRELLGAGSPELSAVAEAVAVLGQEAGLSEVAHVSQVEPLMPALDEGHQAGLLALSVAQARSVITFVEPGAAEAVYDQLLPSRRLSMHRRAAEAVQTEADRLSHRVAASPGADEGLALELEDFVRRRSLAGAWGEVATALFSASRLSADPRSRDDRLLRAVDALVGSGNITEAQMWASAVDAMPSSPLRSSVLGYLSTASGQNHSAQTQLEMAWRTSDPRRDPVAAAEVAQRFVLHGVASWDGPLITQWAETAMSLTESGTPAYVESEAIYGLGLFAQGRLQDAESSYERAFRSAEENAQKQRIQMGAAWLALRVDQLETALVNFEAAVPTEHRGGSLRISLWAEAWLARTQLTLGDWDAAAATVARARVRLETSRMPLIRPLLYWTAAELSSMRGEWDRARHYVSLAGVQPGTYRAMQVPAKLARARFHEARGDYESGLEALEPLTEIDPWTDERVSFWPWQDTYVNALVMTNRLERAEEFLTTFEGVRREREVPSDQARMAWARGRLVAAQGDPDQAREHFEAALGHLRGLNRPYLRARIAFAFGQSMRRAGKRRLASSVLQVARDLYVTLGANAYVERCDRELKATGIDTGDLNDPADPVLEAVGRTAVGRTAVGRTEVELTAQERAVAELVASGATNKETAQSLFVAEKTVQYHLTRIYRKLGIRSRSALAARYRAAD